MHAPVLHVSHPAALDRSSSPVWRRFTRPLRRQVAGYKLRPCQACLRVGRSIELPAACAPRIAGPFRSARVRPGPARSQLDPHRPDSSAPQQVYGAAQSWHCLFAGVAGIEKVIAVNSTPRRGGEISTPGETSGEEDIFVCCGVRENRVRQRLMCELFLQPRSLSSLMRHRDHSSRDHRKPI